MKICFAAHFAYGVPVGDGQGHIEGVKRKAALMARWLADRRHTLSVATWIDFIPLCWRYEPPTSIVN